MIFIDKHLESFLYFFIILIEIVAIVELFDRLGQLSVNFNQFFQTLFEYIVFLFQLLITLIQLLVLVLASEVIFKATHQFCFRLILLILLDGEKIGKICI